VSIGCCRAGVASLGPVTVEQSKLSIHGNLLSAVFKFIVFALCDKTLIKGHQGNTFQQLPSTKTLETKLGKHRQLDYGTPAVSPPAPSSATESLKIPTSGEPSPHHLQDPPPIDMSKGFGGATNAGQLSRRILSQVRGDANQSTSNERTGQEQQEAQAQVESGTIRNQPSVITPTLTEQGVQANYSFDLASQQ
jgi:hypothetical protein